MTCPHCEAGFLPEGAHRCPLCGQLGSGPQTAVSVAEVLPDNDYGAVDDIVTAQLGTQFRIERPLKHGRASHVYLAHDAARHGGREAALKVIVVPTDVAPADGAAFRQAARAAAGLDHPHIAQPYRHGTTESLWWCATDYVPAPSVAERLAAGMGRPLDVPLTWRIAQQIASALDYAHRGGIVHGTLKPADVLLDDAGWVRVVDTGLAPATRVVVGVDDDPACTYRAPESFTSARPVGPLADQYSLALIVRACLTGAPPQAGAVNTAGLPPGAGAHTAQVLQRALAQIPVHRFVDVLDFVAALTGGGRQALGLPPRSPPRGARRPVLLFEPEAPPPRRRLHRLGVGLAVTVAGGALWLGAHAGTNDELMLGRPPEPVAAVPTPAPPPPRAVQPAPQRRAIAPQARAGYLSVNASPWALLSVDGRVIGATPQIRVRVPAGVHRLRLQRAGFKPYEAAVVIKEGETVVIANITLTARTP